jgi:hypothetical protein
MTDRLIVGILTAFLLCITAVLAMLLLSFYRGGAAEVSALWYVAPKFFLSLAAVGFSVGVFLGPTHSVTLFSHLWATAQPRRLLITLFLWVVMIAIGLFTYVYTSHVH